MASATVSVFPATGREAGGDFDENDALEMSTRLLNGYAESKWVAEKILMAARGQGLPIHIYRVGEVVGARGQGSLKASTDASCNFIRACVEMGAAPRLNFHSCRRFWRTP